MILDSYVAEDDTVHDDDEPMLIAGEDQVVWSTEDTSASAE